MRFLHTALNIKDLDKNLNFYLNILGLKEISRYSFNAKRQTVISLAAPHDYLRATAHQTSVIDLIYNWDAPPHQNGTNFAFLSFETEDLYQICSLALEDEVTLLLPPYDGQNAILLSPDEIMVKLIQKGEPLGKQKIWLDLFLKMQF